MNQYNINKEMTVALRDCRFFARHGLLPHERSAGNEFLVSLEASYRLPHGKTVITLQDTISYADIYDIIRLRMQTPADLLETVADRIASDVMERWPVISSLAVTVTKITPPIPTFTGSASVTLRVSR